MQKSAIYHEATREMCYQLNENDLIIRLKTGKDIKKVVLEYGDPFSAGILGDRSRWSGEKIEMVEKVELQNHLLWQVKVSPEYKRCKYFFEISDGNETMYLLEDGIKGEDKLYIEGKREQQFYYPWMNKSDLFVTPTWVKDTIWYQIFPDRFNRASSETRENLLPWKYEKVTSPFVFYGGDIKGVIEKLPYLKDLGISGIYFNPITEGETNHKYDTKDYMKVDPHFGDEKTMKELVEKAHSQDIKIMIDVVFNHCGRKFAPWLDILENGEKSKYFDWFMVNTLPVKEERRPTKDGRYYSFSFSPFMPKLNTNNDEVIKYLCDVTNYWVREFKVDAIRFDVANEVSHSFLKEMRKQVKAINEDVYLLGEIWHNSSKWLQGDEYDSVMNYPITETISEFWLDKDITAKEFEYKINRCMSMYCEQVNDVLFNLLDSHDTERLYSRLNKNKNDFYASLAILFTMQGSPCIYYGTEIAIDGSDDPDCRRCMPWSDIENGKYNNEIDLMKKLISIRKENEACKSKNIKFIQGENQRVIEYIKSDNNNSVRVIVNASNEDIKAPDEQELFSYNVKNNVVKSGGVLITKI